MTTLNKDLLKLFFITILCVLLIPANYCENIDIVVNKDSVDYNYLLNYGLYNITNIIHNNDRPLNKISVYKINNTTVIISKEFNKIVPAINNQLNISFNNSKICVEFNTYDNGLKYKKVEYMDVINLDSDNIFIRFYGGNNKVLKYGDDYIEFECHKKFNISGDTLKYKNLTVKIIAIGIVDGDLYIDAKWNNTDIKKTLKGTEDSYINTPYGKLWYSKSESNWSAKTNKSFVFYLECVKTVKDGDILSTKDGNFTVHIIDNGEHSKIIAYELNNPENLPNSFRFFDYNITYLKTDKNDVSLFLISHTEKNKISNITGQLMLIDNIYNIYLIKKDSNLLIYVNGEEVNNITISNKLKSSSVKYNIYDDDNYNLEKSNNKVYLIGGPVSNKITKKLLDKLPIKITNENPGRYSGVVEKIKNPYKNNSTIYIIGGSDRKGTLGALLAYNRGYYHDNKYLVVKYRSNKIEVVNKSN